MQSAFDQYLNVQLKDRDWRKSLRGIKVRVEATDVYGNKKEGFYIIVISLIGKIVPNHSRIEIFMEGGEIVGLPIFDFSEESKDFLRLFSVPFLRDLLVMLNNFYFRETGSNISLFETGIRRGLKSVIFFKDFFKAFGAQARCVAVPEKEVFRRFNVICFITVVTKKSFWVKLNKAASVMEKS